jgi:hypothetical protein
VILAKESSRVHIKKDETRGQWLTGRSKMSTGCWWVNMKERDHLEHLGIVGRIILKWVLKKQDEKK